jgi:hypothetical protein
MTPNEERLYHAAREVKHYLDRKIAGTLPRGQYEAIVLARELSEALAAVDADRAREDAA